MTTKPRGTTSHEVAPGLTIDLTQQRDQAATQVGSPPLPLDVKDRASGGALQADPAILPGDGGHEPARPAAHHKGATQTAPTASGLASSHPSRVVAAGTARVAGYAWATG